MPRACLGSCDSMLSHFRELLVADARSWYLLLLVKKASSLSSSPPQVVWTSDAVPSALDWRQLHPFAPGENTPVVVRPETLLLISLFTCTTLKGINIVVLHVDLHTINRISGTVVPKSNSIFWCGGLKVATTD